LEWAELRKKFLKRLLAADKELDRSVSDFAEEFRADMKAEGYQLTPALETKLDKFTAAQEPTLKALIGQAALPVIEATGLGEKVQDKVVGGLVKEIFETKYTDGLRLSQRVWITNKTVKRGLRDVVKRAAALEEASGNVIMDMQAVIEEAAGEEFALRFSDRVPGWLAEVDDQVRGLTPTPEAMAEWHRVRTEVEKQISNLAESGTRRGARQYLRDIEEALVSGRTELVDKALKNYLYDKQLYALRRIQRTEASNAYHLAQIRATEEDPDIIGYRWQLSATHPAPDVCDFYASVDHGLGRGVWPKDKVPRRKAHPQCLCDINPVINPSKEKGYKNLDEFMAKYPGAADLKPGWVSDMEAAGAPSSALTGKHGWYSSRKEVVQRLEDRAEAGEAIGKAARKRDWTNQRKHAAKRMAEGYIKSPQELDTRFEAVLADKEARVFTARGGDTKKERYYVLSENTKEVSITDGTGVRRTVHPIDQRTVKEHIKYIGNRAKVRGLDFIELGRLKDLWS
jgi:hypothetical protein